MPVLAALIVSIGVLAVVATWLFAIPLEPYHAQVWQAFVAWACHYHSGGKIAGTRATIICMSFGAVVGMGAGVLAGHIGFLGDFAAPVAVGVGASIIVLASKIPFLSTIPASVYGFAMIAGLFLLGGPEMTPVKSLVPTILSIAIGALFGYVSEVVAGALAKKESSS